MKAIARFLCVLSLTVICMACGGGGGSSAPPPLSGDAGAADMNLADVMLDQIFQTANLNYSATVSVLDSTTTVTASPSNSNATMTVNGTDLVAGMASARITLNQGNNTIAVVVTAEDGVTTTTYTIDVTRETVASFAQRAYIKASNTDATDQFGAVQGLAQIPTDAVALDGDTLVAGAGGEDSSATGIEGDQADNSSMNSGALYVFD